MVDRKRRWLRLDQPIMRWLWLCLPGSLGHTRHSVYAVHPIASRRSALYGNEPILLRCLQVRQVRRVSTDLDHRMSRHSVLHRMAPVFSRATTIAAHTARRWVLGVVPFRG